MATLQTSIRSISVNGNEAKLYPGIVSYKNISNNELVDYMVSNSGVNKATALAAVAALRRLISNYVLNGHVVQVPQLGTFRIGVSTKAVDDYKKCGAGCVERVKMFFTPIVQTRNATKSIKFKGVVAEGDELKMLTD